MKKYWAYRHVNGHIKLRVYRGTDSELAIDDAYDSEFVADVAEKFEASCYADAMVIARRLLASRAFVP